MLTRGQSTAHPTLVDASVNGHEDLQAFLEQLQQDGAASIDAGGRTSSSGGNWTEATEATSLELQVSPASWLEDARDDDSHCQHEPCQDKLAGELSSPTKRRKRSRAVATAVPVPQVDAHARARAVAHVDAATPLALLRGQFGEATAHGLSAKALADIYELSQEVVRADLIDFLGEALPRWQAKGGLWLREQLPEPLMHGSGQSQLFTAYSCLCKLEARMGDDVVRNRVAVAMLHSAYELACKELHAGGGGGGGRGAIGTRRRAAKGRGDASSVIDDILARLHDDWDHAERKVQLRNRFHDKKRYGKRWIILTRTLGDSLLFACSPRIASVVHNTVFTVDMLAALTYCVQHLNPDALRVLDVLNRSAPLILHPGRSHKLDPHQILSDLRAVLPTDITRLY